MSRRYPIQASWLCACLACGVLSCAASSVFAQSVPYREVLDVQEVADLLRVAPDVVKELAASHQIPARLVGVEWRFSHAALLEWLKGEPAAQRVRETPMTIEKQITAKPLQHELAGLAGRGVSPEHKIESMSQTAAPGGNSGPVASIGERPAPAPTTEDIALRDQRVLMPRGAGTIEFGMAYGRTEQSLLPVIRVEQSAFEASGTLRYGLANDLQLTMRAPFAWRNAKSFIDASVTDTNVSSTVSTPENLAEDSSISLLGVGLHETMRRPTVIWSLYGTVPAGPGDRGVGGGLVTSKSYDPAVLFAGFTYLYGTRINPSSPNSSLAKHNFGVQTGYTYALNDTLAISTEFYGTYRDTRSPDGIAIPPPRRNFALQLGSTWLLAPGLFVEPAVAMRIGGDTPGLTLLLNLSRSFSSPKKR